MDALKALAGQQGCSADGTSTTRNPMSQFVNQMGKDGRQLGPGPQRAQSDIRMVDYFKEMILEPVCH